LKQMTVTNSSGGGMYINDAEVELNDVVVRNCELYAINMRARTNSTLVAKRCEFKECQGGLACYANTISHFHDCTFHTHEHYGLFVIDGSTVHLHGESTAVHSNGDGICTQMGAKVLLHLPSHHNTCYNNGNNPNTPSANITNVED